jgi:transcriptional regulator with XRE-family HTH domain
MWFGEKLQEMRQKAGLSQSELADKAGLPVRSIQNWEIKRRLPTYGAILKLSAALGTDCRAFADCEDLLEADGRSKSTAKPTPKRSRPKGRKKG